MGFRTEVILNAHRSKQMVLGFGGVDFRCCETEQLEHISEDRPFELPVLILDCHLLEAVRPCSVLG